MLNILSKVQIRDKAKELRNLLDALAAPHYREQLGLPALRPYDTLLDAVTETSKTLGLPLAEAIENDELDILGSYPLAIWDSPNPQREIVFELVESQYRVQLYSLADDSQFMLGNYTGMTSFFTAKDAKIAKFANFSNSLRSSRSLRLDSCHT